MAASPEQPAAVDMDVSADSPATARINAALMSPTEIVCSNTPLKQLVEQLKSRHKIEIQLDSAGLKDAGLDENTPITKNIKDISLRSALRLLLDELQLKYVVRNEVLLITTPQRVESDEFLVTRLYPVKDLVLIRNADGQIEADFQPLADLITTSIVEKSWLDNGGNGTVITYQFQDRCLLVVTQTQEVHERTAALLDALRRCAGPAATIGKELRLPRRPKPVAPASSLAPSSQSPQPAQAVKSTVLPAVGCAAPSQQPPPPSLRILTPEMAASPEPPEIIDTDISTASAAEKRITAALLSPTTIDCKETPLGQLVEQLKKQHKIEIQLDLASLKDAGVDEKTPVTKHLSGISLRSALRLILDELQLKYVIHNEVLLIISPAKCEYDEFQLTRMYPVKDLILVRNSDDEIETDFQPLIDLIENTIAPKEWIDNGGMWTISAYQFRDRCLLVVSGTQDVHEEVAAFLGALRRCAGPAAKNGGELRLPKRPRTASR